MFEDYKCETIHPVFMMKFIFLDLPLYGSTKIEYMPAQAYCVVFCIFAALIGPFAGFLASGIVSLFVLSKTRDQLSTSIFSGFQRVNKRIAAAAEKEDKIIDGN